MYRLDGEGEGIVAHVREIADAVIGPQAEYADQDSRFPEEGIQALGDQGLMGLTVPREYGGLGQGPRVAIAALDEIAQRDASVAMVVLMHLCGIACYASRPDVAERHLREAARGRHLTTLAWSERGSRSHFWAPVSRAIRADDQIRLNAEKSWVTSAGYADGYVVSTGAAGEESPMASTLYLVLSDDAGARVSGVWDALGMRGNASAPMTLRECAIPASRALSDEGKGFDAMLGVVLPLFAMGNAAVSIGICEAAIASTTQHLTSKRFDETGERLADLPNLRARLARMRIETDMARAHLGAALDAVESGSPSAMLFVLESKAAAGEAALNVTDAAMRACGGAAFSRHLSVERNFRDARAASVMAPTTDVLHDFIGRALCGMELF